jgi:hypothetical protein
MVERVAVPPHHVCVKYMAGAKTLPEGCYEMNRAAQAEAARDAALARAAAAEARAERAEASVGDLYHYAAANLDEYGGGIKSLCLVDARAILGMCEECNGKGHVFTAEWDCVPCPKCAALSAAGKEPK